MTNKERNVEIKPRENKGFDLIKEAFGVEDNFKEGKGTDIEHGERKEELTDSDKALMEADLSTLSATMLLRLGYLKAHMDDCDDNGNPEADKE